ncbi:hypothetical protein V2G26_013359 [Clonostachys chloroleuca]
MREPTQANRTNAHTTHKLGSPILTVLTRISGSQADPIYYAYICRLDVKHLKTQLMNMNFTLLLKNGVALIYDDAKDEFHPVTTDVLIKDGIIESIEPGIVAREGCRVIDCSNKILSPGFVDTHNHHWESPLKGLCENLTALSYFATMFTASTVFSAEDVFWATLAGCMQSIDCGTTTCLDYAHMSWSEDHGSQALAGTLSSGIRSVFAYAPAARLKLTEPDVTFKELLPEWFLSSLKNLAALDIFQAPTTRVQLGLGFDFYFLGEKVVKDVFRLARSLDLKLVTSHWANLSGSDDPGLPEVMQNYGLLDDRIVLSHAGGASSKDCDIINKSQKWFVSSSPSVEMTLGLGVPICFENGSVLQDSACSLGVDCHCLSSTSMISEMRVALLAARGLDARHKLRQGKVPSKVCRTAHDAF